MSNKSHVGLGHHLCPVCLTRTEEVVLLDKCLKETLERDNFLGWEMCKEHKEQTDNDYVHIIIINNPESSDVNLYTADRTGITVAIRRTAFKEIFSTTSMTNIAFGTEELLEKLKAIPINPDKRPAELGGDQ